MIREIAVTVIFCSAGFLVGCGESGEIQDDDGTSSMSDKADSIPSAAKKPVEQASLSAAIAKGDLEQVKAIIEANPDSAKAEANPRMPPLCMAILRQKGAIAKVLIEHGVDVNATDSSQRTPLHLAVERNLRDVVALLIVRHADLTSRDRAGWTPFHLAASKDRVEIMKLLLAASEQPLPLSQCGATPLHNASFHGSAEMIRLLLDFGVDPATKSKTGETALTIAIANENEAAIKLLEDESLRRRSDAERQ